MVTRAKHVHSAAVVAVEESLFLMADAGLFHVTPACALQQESDGSGLKN